MSDETLEHEAGMTRGGIATGLAPLRARSTAGFGRNRPASKLMTRGVAANAAPLAFRRPLACCASPTTIALADWELSESFVRASGPGGQNVNKVATAVALRFEAARSPHLAADVKDRLRRLAGRRWTGEGALIVTAERHRTQALNRDEAREKLRALILAALERPKPRRPTRPTAGSVRRRLEAKAHRAATKQRRAAPAGDA